MSSINRQNVRLIRRRIKSFDNEHRKKFERNNGEEEGEDMQNRTNEKELNTTR
jgi:hypothetical protein